MRTGKKPVKIIQISDMHLFNNAKDELLGVNTQQSFEAVVDLVKSKEKEIDFVLVTGDLSQDGSLAAYQRAASKLDEFRVPIYFIPGNHDDVSAMDKVYPCGNFSSKKQITVDNWQVILLNSQIPGRVAGFLDTSQLEFLKKSLDSHPELNALVACHHHPISVGCAWLDNLGISNFRDFQKLLFSYPNVRMVLFGHVHQHYETVIQKIAFLSLPSTCIQFMRNQDYFGLENLTPGYRWIHLSPNGEFKTGVQRLSNYIGYFDADAKGY